MNTQKEFDRQVANILEKGYPEFSGITHAEFLQHISPLRARVAELPAFEVDLERGKLPFVLVIKSELVPTEKAMAQVARKGITKLYPHQPTSFKVIEEVTVPKEMAYLLIDIDRGKENINLPPNQALPLIWQAGRSPLTIDEGVAIITHFPDFLIKNNCFSLLASRHRGDQRVPAIWINGQKSPNLGWCWDGNPHTWLGSASCAARLGA